MAVGNRYQIRDYQVMGGTQQVMNVYHYLHSAGSGDATTLGPSFVGDVMPQIIAVQGAHVVHDKLEVINLDDPSDFTTIPLSSGNVGTVEGDKLPYTAAWSFRFNRSTRLTRSGRKAIAGVAEADVSGTNSPGATSDALTRLEALAAKLGGLVIDEPDGGTWVPIIVHREPGNPPVYTHYNITGVEYVRIGQQDTRKQY